MAQKVEIFFDPSCPICRQAKEFLTKKGIAFEAHDVIASSSAYDRMRDVSQGARSVPVIVIGKKVLVGFEREKVEKALASE